MANITNDGAVYVTGRPSAGVPSGSPVAGGVATTNDGAVYVVGLTTNDHSRPGYIQFGDSILGNGGNPLVPAITATIGALTATVTIAGHGQWPGAWVLLRGAAQEEFNGWFQVSAYTSSSIFEITLTSPATVTTATAAAASGLRMMTQSRWNDRNVVEVANQLAGNRLRFIANAGLNAQTSAEILARTAADVLNNPMGAPALCFVCAGVNDALNGTAIATTQANLEAIYTTLRGGGVEPVAMTLPPISTAATGYSTTVRAFYLQLNAWIREYASAQGMKLVDLYGAWVDPTDANGNWATNYATSDGIHPSPLAVQRLAKLYLKAQIESWAPPVTPRAVAVVDTYAVTADSRQMNHYPLLGGSGGSGAATVATGYIVAVTGTGATTNTVPSRADGFGSNQRMVVTSAANNDSATLRFTAALGTTYGGQLAVGDRVRLQAVVSLTSITALSRFDLWLEFVSNGVTYFIYGQTNSAGTNWADDMADMVIETPEFTVPPLGITAINMQMRVQFSGAGGATVDTGRIWLGKVA